MSLKRYVLEIPQEEYQKLRLHFIAQAGGYKAMADTWMSERVNRLIEGNKEGALEAEAGVAECESQAAWWALVANSFGVDYGEGGGAA